MTSIVALLVVVATQDPSSVAPNGVPDHPALWPYLVGIGGLSTTVLGLAGYIVKLHSKMASMSEGFQSKLEEVYENQRKADGERSKRVSEEFAKKDQTLVDYIEKFTKLLGEVVTEVRRLNDGERR